MADTEITTAESLDLDAGLSIGSQLCTRCGICCVGALHEAAVLDADEVAGARALGLPVLDRDKPGFALPCPRLDGAICTIYGQRPRVCGRYKCQLLQDTEAGHVALEEAVNTVAVAKDLLSNVLAILPAEVSLYEAKSLVIEMNNAAAPADLFGDGNGRAFKLRVISLFYYLDNHFRNSREGKMLGSTLVGSEIEEEE